MKRTKSNLKSNKQNNAVSRDSFHLNHMLWTGLPSILDPITGFTWVHWNTLYFLIDHGKFHSQLNESVFEDGPSTTPLTLPDDLNFILLSTHESAAWFIHHYANTLVKHGLPSTTQILATEPTLELAKICLNESSLYPCLAYQKASTILETRMNKMMFGQTWHYDSITTIRCCSSGYVLGSSNWVIHHGNHSLGILGPSSIHPDRYFKPLDLDGFFQCSALLVSSMAIESHLDWETLCFQFQSFILQHFTEKKSILIPQSLFKVGFWDTFHLLFRFFLHQPGFQRDWHWMMISKESAKLIAYANTALAFLSNESQELIAQMYMPVFLINHPRLSDLKFHVASSMSDTNFKSLIHEKKLIVSNVPCCFKPITLCGTSVGKSFPLDPRLRMQDLHYILSTVHPYQIITMGAVPPFQGSNLSEKEHRWVNALDQPVFLNESLVPVLLSPEWQEYEQQIQSFDFHRLPMKKVLVQWDLTSNTIYPVEKCRDLIASEALVPESRYLGYCDFQGLLNLLVKKGGPSKFSIDQNVATFPDVPCQLIFDPKLGSIEIALDKVDNADFRYLVETCLNELILKLDI